MEPWLQPKIFPASVMVPPAPIRFANQWSLAPSVMSVTSAGRDKGENRMIQGAVQRSPGINSTAEKNPGKPQLGDHLMKTVRPEIFSNGVLNSK